MLQKIILEDLAMACMHISGVISILQASGGPDVLGLSGLVRYLICAALYGKGLMGLDANLHRVASGLKKDLARF